MRKHAKNCSNSMCLHVQRCQWQYWSIFVCLCVGPSEICEIPRNSLKIQTYRVQGHPRSSIMVPIEIKYNKKAQLSLTNPRDAKACQKLLQFDVLTCTTLSLTILVHSFRCWSLGPSTICEIPRNSLKIQTYRVQGHPRSSILVPIESTYVLSY